MSTTSTATTEAASVFESHLEIRIEGTPTAVWKALTDDIGAWWPDAFFAGGHGSERTYHLEAEVGGRMYESWADGGGLLWGTIVTVEPEKKLQGVGHTFPEWGGPSTMLVTWILEADGDGTLLRFSESTIGRIPEGYGADKEKGWGFLFEGALKAHVEGKPAPTWED